jgi:hypothetical protein
VRLCDDAKLQATHRRQRQAAKIGAHGLERNFRRLADRDFVGLDRRSEQRCRRDGASGRDDEGPKQ